MSKKEKLKKRLYQLPKDFTWDELVTVLSNVGYTEMNAGGTSGRKFVDERMHVISLHKSHPGNIVKHYALKQVVAVLQEKEKLQANSK
ncbi:MAG: hypothetical protein MH132_03830 [Hydrotalea sp.]|nr:hypothetical protein [Hydrotalea sp.]